MVVVEWHRGQAKESRRTGGWKQDIPSACAVGERVFTTATATATATVTGVWLIAKWFVGSSRLGSWDAWIACIKFSCDAVLGLRAGQRQVRRKWQAGIA